MKFNLSSKVFLAPMQGINDIAFLTLCKKAGAEIVFSEMTHPLTQQKIFTLPHSSEAIKKCGLSEQKGKFTKETARCLLDDKIVIQLFSTNEKGIKEFIKKYDRKVFGWDFNLGCPAKTAKKHGFGIFLQNLNSIEKILQTIRSSTKKSFFVKLRKSPQTFEILKIAEKYCDAITIHPRTQTQGYSGKPDLKFAVSLKKYRKQSPISNFPSMFSVPFKSKNKSAGFEKETKLPIIYSGNVDEKNYKTLLKKFDYLMIGRRAIGDPNVFNFFSDKKTNFDFKDYLKLAEKYKLHFRQIKIQAMNFTKRKPDAKKIRLEIFKAKKIEELKKIFD